MYLKLFEKYTKEGATKENIINALSVINATILARMADDKNDDEEVILFSEFFVSHFLNEEMEEAFYDNWGDYPLVLRAGMGLKEDRRKRYYKKYKNSINLLASYIMEKKNEIFVTTTSIYTNQYSFPSEKNKKVKECLVDIITDLFIFDGSMVVREVKGEKFEICGFYVTDNKIVSVPADEMKKCMELQPDGSIRKDEREVYVQAPIIFSNE